MFLNHNYQIWDKLLAPELQCVGGNTHHAMAFEYEEQLPTGSLSFQPNHFIHEPVMNDMETSHSSPGSTTSDSAPRHLSCPFYTADPSKYTKCKDKKFSYMCRVREHISTHTLPFVCDQCQRGFSSKFGLNRHRDTCPAPSGHMRKRKRGQGAASYDGGDVALHGFLTEAESVEDMVWILNGVPSVTSDQGAGADWTFQ
ncbi:hypothetical protein FPQ18DRAFT_407582 [Pyronema domesticum]|nr:hypothetical protein FPQ18DRAFT_407582 [Pyronema domesticum]